MDFFSVARYDKRSFNSSFLHAEPERKSYSLEQSFYSDYVGKYHEKVPANCKITASDEYENSRKKCRWYFPLVASYYSIRFGLMG